MSPTPAAPRALVLKVTLADVEPAVWRRIAVPRDITLQKLHKVLQSAMGWEDCHLHEFRIGDTDYGPADLDDAHRIASERGKRLHKLVGGPGFRFRYVYDFGDHWEHVVEVEGEPAEVLRLPLCLDGARACPPEDCGGALAYATFLEAMADPAHARHAEVAEWIGGAFDPEAFDPAAVNGVLARLR
jgi:hypothetical protein